MLATKPPVDPPKKPVERKLPKKLGDVLECTHAETRFFTKGATYTVVPDPITGAMSIIGNDGLFDLLCMVTSKFDHYKPRKKKDA